MTQSDVLGNVLEELLTERETAALLRLKNHRTLSVWRCTGRHALPYVKYGRMVRYRKKDVLAFIDSHTVQPL